MKKAIWFDMDGTIADLYNVPNWLPKLLAEDASPYKAASTIGNMSTLAKAIHKAQAKGYTVGIISWTSKGGSANYNTKVAAAKLAWLKKHLASVKFDTIHIVPYGTNKSAVAAFSLTMRLPTEQTGMAKHTTLPTSSTFLTLSYKNHNKSK